MTLGVSSLHHNAATGSRIRSESFLEISDASFFLDHSLLSHPQAINSFAVSKFEARSILVVSGYVDRQLIPKVLRIKIRDVSDVLSACGSSSIINCNPRGSLLFQSFTFSTLGFSEYCKSAGNHEFWI